MSNDVKIDEQRIEYLPFPDCIRKRTGMYLGSTGQDAINTCLREVLDNSCDEVAEGFGDLVHVSNNFNGYHYVADNGRGIPIRMSTDKPDKTEAYLSISELHSSGKFKPGAIGRAGINGIGSSAVNACSEVYILMIRVRQENYLDSTARVREVWETAGPRSKNDIYYIVVCEKGEKVYEDCLHLREAEKKIFRGIKDYMPIPKGMSTIVFFKPDPEVFEISSSAKIPYANLNYFLLIQRQFFGRKIRVEVDGKNLVGEFNPYQFEIIKSIVPKDPRSPNKEVGVYLTFEEDPDFGKVQEWGSVNGLDCRLGYHMNLAKNLFKAAFKSYFKVSHDYVLDGLKYGIILLANECVFSSQVKENLKSLSKVKADDFIPIVKEIEKIFRKNEEFWRNHIEKVNQIYDAHRSIGAIEKAQKMMDASSGSSFYKSKANLVEGFSDATLRNRWDCELFIVEGNSPAGSLKSGRRAIGGGLKQAVLPLRGKVLNVSSIDIDRALENKEISTLFSILGVGIQANNVTTGAQSWEEAHDRLMKQSRFGKIVISCDADAD